MQLGVIKQQANLISLNILDQLKSERQEYLNAVSSVETQILKTVDNSKPPMIKELTSHNFLQPSANGVAHDSMMLKVLKLLKEIKDDSSPKKRERNTQNDENTSEKENTKPQRNKKKKKIQLDTSKYCWSCGACGHKGKNGVIKRKITKTIQHSK